MSQIKIKVQDVFHEEDADYSVAEINSYIEDGLQVHDVDSVDIRPGHSNTPIVITLERSVSAISLDTATRIARVAVNHFGHRVDGVSVSETISDDNVLVKR